VSLPADSTFLPLARGQLLVSRAHAAFCPIDEEEMPLVRGMLAGEGEPRSLPKPLADKLARHGLFGPPRPAPPVVPSVQLQITNACNLGCAYCCTNSGQARPIELGLARYQRIAREIRAALGPGTRVAILGGEPFLVPWAIDLAEDIVGLGLSLCIFSNGMPLADAGLARRVAALIGRGCEVRVSLAGPTPEICDRVSGARRFDTVMAGLDALARHGATAKLDLMLLPEDVEHVAEHLPALRRRLPAGTLVAVGILYHSGREQGAHLFRSRGDLEAALDQIAFGAGETIPATPRSPVAERREGCGCALGHHLHVRSDGALFTCFKMEERVGDLGETDFGQALAAVRAKPHPATTLEDCKDCALSTLCGGGCRSENLQYTGSPDRVLCGPWRVRVLSELLAEDRVSAVEWPLAHLLAEAHRRGIEAPTILEPVTPSRHLLE
jgi:radical SAM protein with 4Fe4S-binding SPASM domain